MLNLLQNKRVVFFLGIVFFFSLVRYWGFYEDAGRYLLQVVHYVNPERFENDVPFMFGNQDSYTIFSPLILLFYKAFGVNTGGMLASFASQLLWCVAVICLMVSWTTYFKCQSWAFPTFIVCIATLITKSYGSGEHFLIIDGILVARFLAMGIVLFAFTFFFSKNKYVSLILFLLASFVHPLIGGWGLPLWLFYHYPRTRIFILIAALLFPLSECLHVGRLDIYPNDWMTPPLFFTPKINDTIVFVFILSFWLFMSRFLKAMPIATFCSNMFWVCAVGVFFTYAGVYMKHILLFQAQPFRVILFSVVPMFPVTAVFFHEKISNGSIKNLIGKIPLNLTLIKGIYIAGFFVIALMAVIANYVQMALEQNMGNVQLACLLMDFPDKLIVARYLVLAIMAFICLCQGKFYLALAFGFSLFNEQMVCLPLLTIIFYLDSDIKGMMKKCLLSLLVVLSFAEMLLSLQKSPLQNSFLGVLMLILLFFLILWVIKRVSDSGKKVLLPLCCVLGIVAVWDFLKWDAREESRQIAEQQMDQFWNAPVFPQVADRGKTLFVVDRESPIQSRFVFLTGTYADETISIGEIFYKGQHIEAARRKNALLYGDSVMGNLSNYSFDIQLVYSNLDKLLPNVRYLCSIGDITHLITDYNNVSLLKVDSTYLDAKKKYVFLYECNR